MKGINRSKFLQYVQIGLALIIAYLVYENGKRNHEELKLACAK